MHYVYLMTCAEGIFSVLSICFLPPENEGITLLKCIAWFFLWHLKKNFVVLMQYYHVNWIQKKKMFLKVSERDFATSWGVPV